MLTTRPAKRDRSTFFSTDLMFDILDHDAPIGSLVYDKKKLAAIITLGGSIYTVARDRPDERVYQALIRVVTGGEKPSPNPWALKDSGDRTLALGEQVKQQFVVGRGADNFTFRRVKRAFHLFRQGNEQSLGSVGQEKLLGAMFQMNLPRGEFDVPFQVFLLTLLLSLTMKNLENYSG